MDDSFPSGWHAGPSHDSQAGFNYSNWATPATPPPTTATTPNLWTPTELSHKTSTSLRSNASPSLFSPTSTAAYEQVRDELGQIKQLAKSLERRLDTITKLRPSHRDGGFHLETGNNNNIFDPSFGFGVSESQALGMTGAGTLDALGNWSQCNDEMEFRHRLTALQERLGAAIADVGLLMLEQDS